MGKSANRLLNRSDDNQKIKGYNVKISSLVPSILILASMVSANAFADSEFVDRTTIMEKPYACNNGGTITLLNTRYGNVKKVVFAKPGHLDEIGYVRFSIMTDYYMGTIVPYKTFPEPKSGDDSVESRIYADMEITYDGKGLKLVVQPVRTPGSTGFTCQNY